MYRDVGSSAIIGNGQEVERVSKKLLKMFQDEGLDITAEANIKVVDFLYVILDLKSGTYKPYSKPDSCTKYISPDSSYPPCNIGYIFVALFRVFNSLINQKSSF